MAMIIWILSSLFAVFFQGYCQFVSFDLSQNCYSVRNSVTITAVYSGSGTVTAVQWYYSGQLGTNLIVSTSTCSVFGSIHPGYPNASRMSYECPTTHYLPTNTFKLTLTGLQVDELYRSWGATFYLSDIPSPNIISADITECDGFSTKLVSTPTTTAISMTTRADFGSNTSNTLSAGTFAFLFPLVFTNIVILAY